MKSFRTIIPVWSAVLLLFTATPCRADPRAEFDKAYAIYQKHADNREWEQALTSAEDAYYLGVKAFGRESINTGNLGFNYGRLLNRFERFEDAQEVLLSTLHVYEGQYGSDSTRLIDVLVELGKASWSPQYEDTSLAYFERAASLARGLEPMPRAMIEMLIGLFLSNEVESPGAVPFLERAHESYLRLVGASDVRTAIAQMQLAKWKLVGGQFKAALDMLRSPLAVFVAAPENRGLEMATRAYMVQALERLGRRDEATEHCLEIGRMSSREIFLPLTRVQPVYPPSALKRGQSGWVVVEFTVDEEGYVRLARVAVSSSDLFNDAAIAAAEQFRYAPRFENGKPVETAGVQNRITFDIVD